MIERIFQTSPFSYYRFFRFCVTLRIFAEMFKCKLSGYRSVFGGNISVNLWSSFDCFILNFPTSMRKISSDIFRFFIKTNQSSFKNWA